MKRRLALLLLATAAFAATEPEKNAPANNAGAPKTPAKPATQSPVTAPAKKPEPAPAAKVEGMEVARSSKGFLGVALVGGCFRITFYDANRKPVAADVTSASLRWTVKYQPKPERTLLVPAGDGRSLASPFVVRPPLAFRLNISLFVEGREEPSEIYQIDFRG